VPSSTRSSDAQTGQNLHRLSSGTACNHRAVTDQPAPTDEEHEQAPDRQAEEEGKQGVNPEDLEDEEQ
jgi:hypothetical protein